MTTIGDRLIREHREIDALCEEIANGVRRGDIPALDASWTDIESRLVSHMDFEETHLLVHFESVAPAESSRLQEDHARIRRALFDLGVAIGHRTNQEESIGELLVLLREHAARETKLLYPWSSAPSPVRCDGTPVVG